MTMKCRGSDVKVTRDVHSILTRLPLTLRPFSCGDRPKDDWGQHDGGKTIKNEKKSKQRQRRTGWRGARATLKNGRKKTTKRTVHGR